jgi:hypothetical protein
MEDLSYAAIYSLGLTIINFIDHDAALSIIKTITNKEFEATNKELEALLKGKLPYRFSLFFSASMINVELNQRPSLILLELSLRNTLNLMVFNNHNKVISRNSLNLIKNKKVVQRR